MQYFTPEGDFFVGDCMPFYHDGVFHLYYLLDEGHHSQRGGLGCHQWAHATTTDLMEWEHHPLALPIEHEYEGSICTGSAFFHSGVYYAFYANRRPDRSQELCVAVSSDGVHFEKSADNPFAKPQDGYEPDHYRDPCIFRDEKSRLFHLLATAQLSAHPLHGRGGCLAHLVSADLANWELQTPFIIPGYYGAPECPDYFEWNGWYYLIFSHDGVARYRMSRDPFGPWERPKVDSFDGPMARVMKTAAFGPERRIGVAFLPSVADERDGGGWLYAGNAVFREIIQHSDGTLGSRFPAEMIPASESPLELPFEALTGGVQRTCGTVSIDAVGTIAAGVFNNVPTECRIAMTISPAGPGVMYGLVLRAEGGCESGYELHISPAEGKVELRRVGARSISLDGSHAIFGVEGLDRTIRLEIVMTDDIIDVCVDGRRCLVNRFPELRGPRMFLVCQDGCASFEDIAVSELV